MTNKRPTKEDRELVLQAIADHMDGNPPSVRCPDCGELLHVDMIKELAHLWVICPNKCLVVTTNASMDESKTE